MVNGIIDTVTEQKMEQWTEWSVGLSMDRSLNKRWSCHLICLWIEDGMVDRAIDRSVFELPMPHYFPTGQRCTLLSYLQERLLEFSSSSSCKKQTKQNQKVKHFSKSGNKLIRDSANASNMQNMTLGRPTDLPRFRKKSTFGVCFC